MSQSSSLCLCLRENILVCMNKAEKTFTGPLSIKDNSWELTYASSCSLWFKVGNQVKPSIKGFLVVKHGKDLNGLFFFFTLTKENMWKSCLFLLWSIKKLVSRIFFLGNWNKNFESWPIKAKSIHWTVGKSLGSQNKSPESVRKCEKAWHRSNPREGGK